MKFKDLKRNGAQMLVGRVMLAMDKGYYYPADIARVIDAPIELVTEAYKLIVDYQNKESGK